MLVRRYFHQKILNVVRRFDDLLFFVNSFYLFWIASLPLLVQASSVFLTIESDDEKKAVGFFCLGVFGAGVSLLVLWVFVHNDKQRSNPLSHMLMRRNLVVLHCAILATIFSALVGFGVVFINTHYATVVLLTTILITTSFVFTINRGGFVA